MSIYKEVCNLKNSFDALLEYVQGGGTLDAEVWGKLAEMKPVMSKLRDVHIRQETVKGASNSELAELWKLCPPRVERINKTRPQPDQKPLPNKLVVFMGNEITVPRGGRWIAYDSQRIVWVFSKEPELIDNRWRSDALSSCICGITNVPADDWRDSLRKVSHLEEIR
jgi:hypothetical protein